MPQQPLDNPFAQQPTNLASPVPSEAAKQQLQGLFAEAPSTQVNLDAPEEVAGDSAPIADAAAQLQGLFQAPVVDPTLEAESPLPAPTGFESAKEQLNETFTRLKHSFAVGDKESAQVLNDSGLFDGVRIGPEGNMQVKRKGRQGFEDFDRDKVELLGDTLDWSRDILEGLVESGFKIGGGVSGATVGAGSGAAQGAVAGSVVPGLGTATGAVTGGGLGAISGGTLGAAAGGAAGAGLALSVGDQVAEKLLGIERDPRRNRLNEAAVASAFGAGITTLGSKMSRSKAIKQFKNEAAQKTVEFAKGRAKQVTDMIEQVRSSGIKIDPETGRFRLDPNQITGGEIPSLEATAKELSKNTAVQNFKREQGELLKGAYDSIIDVIGAKAGRSSELGKDFVITAKDINKAEGALIGNFRSLARKELVNQPQRANNFINATREAFELMGGRVQTGRDGLTFSTPDVDTILQQFPAFTPSQAKAYKGEMDGIIKELRKSGGNLTVDQAERIYKNLKTKINKTIGTSAGRPYAMELIKIKDGIRDDWTGMIEQVLPEGQKAAYAKSMARYSDLMTATKNLQNVLKTEDISRDALVSTLFEGKNSLKLARNAKTIIEETDPKFWQDITTDYFKKLKAEHFDELSGQVNWAGMAAKWKKLPKEMQDELVAGSGLPQKGFESLMNIGRLYQKADFKELPPNTSRGIFMSLYNIFGNTMAGTKGNAAANLMEGIGGDASMMRWLKEGGMEDVLKHMPGLKQNKKQALVNWIEDWTPKGVRSTIGQGAKTSSRRSFQDLFAPQGEE